MTIRQEIAQKILDIANDPEADKILITLPENHVGLPTGVYVLSNFLTYVSDCLGIKGEEGQPTPD